MNILEQEDIIKGLPDAALMQEASAPSGQVPQFLVISEIKRRSDMRKRFEKEQQPQGTVKDQIVMEAMGIAPMMPNAMTPPAQPMGPAGPPPNGAMPPPMGGMPPQGAPPMAPPMPQGMPPMPQGGIASAPPAMPPMGMAQGGIVRMQQGGVLDMPTPAGSTVRQQIDEAIALGMPYADLLAFIADKFPGSPEVREYLIAKTQGEGTGMESVGGMTAGDRKAVSEAAPMRMMPKLAGGSDLYKGPMVLRAADALGLFDSYKSKPEDNRMLEPAASALAQQVVDEYAVPDTGIRGIFASSASDDLGIASIGGGDARVQAAGSAEVQSQPARLARDPFSDPSVVAGLEQNRQQAGDFLSGLNQRIAERQAAGGNRDMRLMNIPEDAIIGDKGEPTVVTEAVTALAETPGPQDRSNKIVDIAQSNRELGIGPRGPVSNPFGTKKIADAPSGMTASERDELSGILASLTKGKNDTPALTESKKDTPMPALDFSDLIADSKKQALANAMIQLGAGVASGDVSKGLAAAGTAAMKGTAGARELDMRRRLAEYQAGREDIRRGEETRRYEEGMKLKREQFDSDVAYRAAKLSADIDAASGLNRRALLTNVSAMIKETNDEILRLQSLGSGPEDPAMMELQSYLNVLKTQSEKYANEIAASLARADEFDGFEVVGTR